MTRQRYDDKSTEFGLWLREQDCLHSKKYGYVATNLDYIWGNYLTGLWLLLEEKRYNGKLTYSQANQFKLLHKMASLDDNYRGFHLIVFENTSPDDGEMRLNREIITKDELLDFLMFNRIEASFFPEVPDVRY